MKICIISNSHLASLKKGAHLLRADDSVTNLTFFGSPNRGIARLRPNNKRTALLCRNERITEHLFQSSGGKREITLADYDAFIVYGLFLTIPQLDQRLSSQVMQQSLEDTVNLSLAFRTVKKLRALSSKPIFCSPEPLLSENRFQQGHKRPGKYILPLEKTQALIRAKVESENTWYIKQPHDSVAKDFSTKAEFGKNSLRFGGQEHRERDIRHMNAEYGRLYLKEAIAAIQRKQL